MLWSKKYVMYSASNFLEVFIERAEKLVEVDEANKRGLNSAQNEVNPEKYNEINTGEKALILDPIDEQIKMRRNSSESATSAYRRRRTFAEKLFLTKHTQSGKNLYIFFDIF